MINSWSFMFYKNSGVRRLLACEKPNADACVPHDVNQYV